jgi:hypothetical protein
MHEDRNEMAVVLFEDCPSAKLLQEFIGLSLMMVLARYGFLFSLIYGLTGDLDGRFRWRSCRL